MVMLKRDCENLDEEQLNRLVYELQLSAENFESEFSSTLRAIGELDNTLLVVRPDGTRSVEATVGQDERFLRWCENVLQLVQEFTEWTGRLRENLEKVDTVLEYLGAIRELIEMAPSGNTVVVEDFWLERYEYEVGWVRIEPREARIGDYVRVGIKLHNTDWLARGRTWLWFGGFLEGLEGYADLGATQTLTTYVDEFTIPRWYREDYFVSVEGRWESWALIFFVWTKTGEGEISKQELVINKRPKSSVRPVEPQEPSPWGTTFTYWTDIDDPDGETVTVTLYKDGIKYGDSKTVHGSGSPSWTWTSTADDIGEHTYYFEITDEYGVTVYDPPTGVHSGPTVTKRSTTLTITVSDDTPAFGQLITFTGELRDEFGEPVAGKTIRLYKTKINENPVDTGLSATTDSQGRYTISFVYEDTEVFGYFASFEEDNLYFGCESGKIWIGDTEPPPAPEVQSDTHPDPNVWYARSEVVFSWPTPPDDSGIVGYSYALDSLPNETIETTGNSVLLQDVPDGEHWFYVRAQDGAGNWTPDDAVESKACRVRIDTKAVQSEYQGFFLSGVSMPNNYYFIPPSNVTVTGVTFKMGGTSVPGEKNERR